MRCKLHFHLSGKAKVKRLILDERKKKKAKQTDVSEQCWSLVFDVSIWFRRYFFFVLFCGLRNLFEEREAWVIFLESRLKGCSDGRDSGRLSPNKGSRVKWVDKQSQKMTRAPTRPLNQACEYSLCLSPLAPTVWLLTSASSTASPSPWDSFSRFRC